MPVIGRSAVLVMVGLWAGLIGFSNPAWAQWSERAPMSVARAHAGAAVLNNEIYVAGGAGIAGPRDVFEAYDIQGDHWRPLKAMPAAAQQFGMAALGGQVYISGGQAKNAESIVASDDLWVYDPASSRWSERTSMPAPRVGHVMVPLNGKLYVIGGLGPGSDNVFVYDIFADQWSTTPAPLPTPRTGLAAVALGEKIYAIGGRRSVAANLDIVEVYDTNTKKWSRAANLTAPRAGLTAGALNGRIHVTGGETLSPARTYSDHFIYDPAADRWTSGAPLPTPRHGLVSSVVDGKWYVIGGGAGADFFTVFTAMRVVEVFRPSGN